MRPLRFRIWVGFLTLIAKSMLYVFALPPLRISHACGRLLGAMAYRFRGEMYFASQRNIATCLPELTLQQQQQLIRTSLLQTGMGLLETAAMLLWPGKRVLKLIRQIHNAELFETAMAHGKGIILVSPHLGSWELISLYASTRIATTSLYRKPRLPAMDNIIRHGRERLGARLVPTDNSGVRALLSALKQGELVFILPDQQPKPGQGEFAPFFGVSAYSMTLLPRLVQKAPQAQVIYAYSKRLPRGAGFDLYFHAADEAIRDPDLAMAMGAMNADAERCIRENPEQYLWSYRRFKLRPEGEGNIYVKGKSNVL